MDAILTDMFHLGLPWAEKVLRPVVVYAFLVIGLRLAGKRELAQLNPYDLVVLLTISNTVQNAIIGNDNSVTGGLIGAVVLMAFNFVVVRFLYHHEKIDRIIEGDAILLVDNGRVMKDALDRELITLPELESVAHRQGFESLDEVQRCIIEPGGTLAMFGKKPSTGEARQDDLIARLDEIKAMIAARGTA